MLPFKKWAQPVVKRWQSDWLRQNENNLEIKGRGCVISHLTPLEQFDGLDAAGFNDTELAIADTMVNR